MKNLEITKIDGSIVKINEADLYYEGDAFISGRLIPYNPDGKLFEMCQYLSDKEDNQYKASWIFKEGLDLDEYNYDLANAEIVEVDID